MRENTIFAEKTKYKDAFVSALCDYISMHVPNSFECVLHVCLPVYPSPSHAQMYMVECIVHTQRDQHQQCLWDVWPSVHQSFSALPMCTRSLYMCSSLCACTPSTANAIDAVPVCAMTPTHTLTCPKSVDDVTFDQKKDSHFSAAL